MKEYPELDKRKALGDDYGLAIEIVEHIKSKFHLGTFEDWEFHPTHARTEQIVCEFFNLDYDAISRETEALLKEVQAQASC